MLHLNYISNIGSTKVFFIAKWKDIENMQWHIIANCKVENIVICSNLLLSFSENSLPSYFRTNLTTRKLHADTFPVQVYNKTVQEKCSVNKMNICLKYKLQEVVCKPIF